MYKYRCKHLEFNSNKVITSILYYRYWSAYCTEHSSFIYAYIYIYNDSEPDVLEHVVRLDRLGNTHADVYENTHTVGNMHFFTMYTNCSQTGIKTHFRGVIKKWRDWLENKPIHNFPIYPICLYVIFYRNSIVEHTDDFDIFFPIV